MPVEEDEIYIVILNKFLFLFLFNCEVLVQSNSITTLKLLIRLFYNVFDKEIHLCICSKVE